MFEHIKKYSKLVLVTMAAGFQLTACNKIPEVEEIQPEIPEGRTIAEIINTEPQYSLMKLAATKGGIMATLSNPDAQLTLLAVDNDAFALSGINEAIINALPAATVAGIAQYHIIPQALPTTSITDAYPNVQMPTLIQLPGAPAVIKMPTFLSRRGDMAFVNNIPVKEANIQASNGVIHDVFAVVAPPTRVVMDSIARDTSLTFFTAAIARADEGLPDGSKFSQLLANPLANFTVFAPDNNAFKMLLAGLGLPPDPSVIGMLPIQTVQGIVAYHIHILDGSPPADPTKIKFARAFTVNFPTTPSPVKTFLNVVIDPAPPLILDAAQGVKGWVNPTFSKIIGANRNAVNGVVHKIDQVLRPQ
ncbi:fasciclin domain-containing protein [Flavihumibacter solisilvae]|uniref:FAS1 domain-containing protein n=1 Tax=Flavihumibacter solisilvae TaxID=1349421 RepID=A0A0C1L5U1_9BACT|nr:fasciclin domain-containing protein [Flavihumibacter solisilvae]KIC94881.1 hypothetical protein OI18_08185 [Flavihumibacter solisilvae]